MGSESRTCGNVSSFSPYLLLWWTLLLCSKDVRLPAGFQRAMAAEAESAREARAKVIVLPHFL